MHPVRLTLVGGGDRLDHTLAAIGALGAPTLTGVPAIDGWWDGQHLDVVHGPARVTLLLRPGSTLSLLALHGPCRNVVIDGVRWPLAGDDLGPAVGLGVSNEVTATGGVVSIAVSSGVLTVLDVPAVPARTDREEDR
jgi:thiamine pyrophosphokinase